MNIPTRDERSYPLEYLTRAYSTLRMGRFSTTAILNVERILGVPLPATRLCFAMSFEMWLANEGLHAL